MSSESETGKIKKASDARAQENGVASTRKTARGGPRLQTRQLVRFNLDREEYGIDVYLVDEIRRATGIIAGEVVSTRICGTIQVKEQMVEVIDTRTCLGYPARPVDSLARIILVSYKEKVCGMLVDGVSEVLRMPKKAQKAPGASLGPVDPKLIQEIFVVDEQQIAVLDWPRILDL